MSAVSLLFLVIGAGTVYLISHKILSMEFRAANDALHKEEAPITLDFLIPGGTYVDEKMTIEEVLKTRLQKPEKKLDSFVRKLSDIIPHKYLLLASMILYLFWTFIFLVFFRIFTWIGYSVALSISFFAGSLVYFFMPDLLFGRTDDVVFLVWAVIFAAACRWYSKRRRLKHLYS
jgi:Fe2+ transport system protein B